MAWRVPWVVAWFVSWVGPYTSLPSALPSDAQPDALILDNVPLHVLVPGDAQGNTVRVNLVVQNSCVNSDGFPRCAVLVGKDDEEPTLPGPVVSGNKGDRFLINVTNKLEDESMLTGTTIHWHGIHQYHSSQMDGTEGTTQCVIGPEASFLYDFTGGYQVGTYWYHSHYGVQYCDGLRGPFIIRDDEDKERYGYDVDDDDTIITLMDWYHYPSVVTPRQIWPDSVLINGIGCYPGMACEPPHTFTVESGKRYRFRLLNMACRSYYDFSIDGHDLEVMEVEGTYVEPYMVSSIRIFAAQRYSFILRARPNAAKSCNYRIHAIPNPNEHNNASNTAILRYDDAEQFCTETVEPTVEPLNEACLRSRDGIDKRLLGPADASYILNITKSDANFNFLVDGFQYTPPTIPILLQIMSGQKLDELEPWKSIIPLEKDELIELIFNIDSAGRPHPFHLHGHSFAVIKSADGVCPGAGDPVMRDTVNTGLNAATNGVTIRFITDNPGPWLLHCHNEWHLWTGMALVFVEDYEDIKTQPYRTATDRAMCTYEPKSYFALPPVRTEAGPYILPTLPTCTPSQGCPFKKSTS